MLTLGLLLCALVTPPSPCFDPARSWFTIETGHFSVHFSVRGRLTAESERLARDVAGIAEEARATVLSSTGSAPSGRVNIIIADFYDYWNGWATPFPNNTITIIPTPPAGDRSNDDNWLRTLILHEYSHILQMEMATGPARFLRSVIGRIALPNALLPASLTEGYAIYNETRFSSFGRLRSAEYDMTLRAAADSNRWQPIDRCSGYDLRHYPSGTAPYLYGSRLLGLTAAGRPDIWDRFNADHASLLPFLDQVHALRLFDRNLNALWSEVRSGFVAHAESVGRRLGARPLTSMRRVTSEGFATGSPCWSKDGSRVYYLSRNGLEYPAIKSIRTDGEDAHILHRGPVTGPLSLSPDGRELAFTQYEVVRSGYDLTDVYALDLRTGAVRRITRGLRARDPDFAPDTSLMVFVTNHDAHNDLVLLDTRSGALRGLTEAGERTGYSRPRFSPGGRWIAVCVSHPAGYTDIELIDRNTGWRVPVTNDRATDLSPCWSHAGRYLFFVSDRTGVFNLYAYSISDSRLYQCSNVLYGVFEPASGPNTRRIALVSHSAEGDDISELAVTPADWRPAPDFVDTFPIAERVPPDAPATLYYYSPIPSVLPTFWLPWYSPGGSRELGAFTLGWDALQTHAYSAMAGYRFGGRTPFLRLGYTLARWRPNLLLSADCDLHRQNSDVGLALPLLFTAGAASADVGVKLTHDSLFSSVFRLSSACSNARTYRLAAAPSEGRAAGLALDVEDERLAGRWNRTRVLAYWVEYSGLPRQNWSLRWRMAAGAAWGDESADSAFALDIEPGLLGVRGFSAIGSAGRYAAVGNIQFRVPLLWPERGVATLPVFLQNINAAAFVDAGSAMTLLAWDSFGNGARAGVGLELRADLAVFHHVPLQISGGLAIGFYPELSRRFYFRVESAMLAALMERPALRPAALSEPGW